MNSIRRKSKSHNSINICVLLLLLVYLVNLLLQVYAGIPALILPYRSFEQDSINV